VDDSLGDPGLYAVAMLAFSPKCLLSKYAMRMTRPIPASAGRSSGATLIRRLEARKVIPRTLAVAATPRVVGIEVRRQRPRMS